MLICVAQTERDTIANRSDQATQTKKTGSDGFIIYDRHDLEGYIDTHRLGAYAYEQRCKSVQQ